jgi:leucyl-tRNA synthetase
MKLNIYSPGEIEKKYNELWGTGSYINSKQNYKGKFYCLDMFPYPSANGVHVGHWRGYVLSDIYARQKWLEGYEILHPMGWDAFGLPAENYAIKNKIHPEAAVKNSIANFKEQIKKIGALYDWSKEINTTDPHYYKWTQWIFLKMYKAGLAYQSYTDMNWCPSCKTGLANEEVVKNVCERCGSVVEEKKIRQWMLKITKYAEQLLDGLDNLDWPEKVKTMQRNWIGKSIGVEIVFKINNEKKYDLLIYTTCPETIYGVTFIAISYNNPNLWDIVRPEYRVEVEKNIQLFIEEGKNKSEDNLFDGFFIHQYAHNPITNNLIPIYIARYVINDYGTGALMGVPGHDNRDYLFAIKHSIPVKTVIMDPRGDNDSFYEGNGLLLNSNQFDGMDAKTSGKKAIIEFLMQQKVAVKKVNYKMRDWIFSRQRYWGEPIPLIHCPMCGVVGVPEDQLPVILPYVEYYEATGTGESPLAGIDSWVNVKCFTCGGDAKRETNTMPQWAGSCWYFLRYPDSNYDRGLCSPESMKKWFPIDLYVGGVEHAILHLLYSRFYVKFLYENKIIPFSEPFLHLFNQGMINKKSEKTGLIEKMSKSKGNVVNPDDIIEKYGTDTLRLYIIFIAPPEMDCQWQEDSLLGCYRFLKRFWHCMTSEEYFSNEYSLISDKAVNLFLKTFSDRINSMHTNTAVSAMMEFINLVMQDKLKLNNDMRKKVIINCSIMVPYICQELLTQYNLNLVDACWANYDSSLLVENNITIVIQVNGKLRDIMIVEKSFSRAMIESIAKEKISKWIIDIDEEKIKIIYVQGKLINFVFLN